jgi:hypothetical protein
MFTELGYWSLEATKHLTSSFDLSRVQVRSSAMRGLSEDAGAKLNPSSLGYC